MYQYPKPYLSISQLIQKLSSAGMEISSQDEAEEAFYTIGYYRLKGYCYHRFDRNTNSYIQGTNFKDVLNLYYFDAELSNLIFGYISKIEVALRARAVHAFQPSQDVLALNDPSFFDDKANYWQNLGSIASEIARSKDVFINHNFTNHEGAIPLWAAVEIMSFGTLSKLIKNLKTGQNSVCSRLIQSYRYLNANGNLVNPSKEMFASWVHAVSAMRNICAHNGRIYNRTINTIPRLIAADSINPPPRYNGLYQIILAMKYLRPTNQSWKDFVVELNGLLQKYSGAYDLNRMNFPADWESHLQV
jgi:abortive infection bacteriophage resistance protein